MPSISERFPEIPLLHHFPHEGLAEESPLNEDPFITLSRIRLPEAEELVRAAGLGCEWLLKWLCWLSIEYADPATDCCRDLLYISCNLEFVRRVYDFSPPSDSSTEFCLE